MKRGWLPFALSGLLVVALTGMPARAATEPIDDVETGLDDRVVGLAVDLARTDRELTDTERKLGMMQLRLTNAQASLAVHVGFAVTNLDAISVLRRRVRYDAATAYVRSGTTQAMQLSTSSLEDLDRVSQYASTISRIDSQALDQMVLLQRQLERREAEQAATRDEVVSLERKLETQRTRLAELRRAEQTQLDAWGAVTVMGPSQLTSEQIASWFRSTGVSPNLAEGTSIDDVARLYVEEGRAEGVRGDLAFAQSIVETGYFRVAGGNNYAGIGACDSCEGGLGFDTPRAGVRAQIQLLRNYGDPDSRTSNLAHPPEPGLYGNDPGRAAALFDSFFLKGKAPVWNVMGGGNWATDEHYSRKVIEVFARMVAFAGSSR